MTEWAGSLGVLVVAGSFEPGETELAPLRTAVPDLRLRALRLVGPTRAANYTVRARRKLRSAARRLRLVPPAPARGTRPANARWAYDVDKVLRVLDRAPGTAVLVVLDAYATAVGWYVARVRPEILVVSGTAAACRFLDGTVARPVDLAPRASLLRSDSVVEAVMPFGGSAEAEGISLLVGPRNLDAQAARWARACEPEALGIALSSGAPGATLVLPADIAVGRAEWDDDVVRASVTRATRTTHVLVESLMAFPGMDGPLTWTEDPAVGADAVRGMLAAGRRVAVVLHRDDVVGERADSVREALARLDIPVLVSEPSLVPLVPGSVWLPVVLGSDGLQVGAPPLTGDRPLVLDASGEAAETVPAALRDLVVSGVIEVRAIADVPASLVPVVMRSADIVVGRVSSATTVAPSLGPTIWGVGRVLITSVHDPLPDGRAVPAVAADLDSLSAAVGGVLADRAGAAALARAGHALARELHDGRAAARVLRTIVFGV